ncbi:hypothetical protein [Stieleria varia]|uniref:DUF3352 domain-containing protein n=1 Tax=Stieleria varia TaxID=2528005 RepID=A0A5C6AY92_9BACT|nr:hypothetical protein [Stieleria varia]TWU04618.1 hypothetical protein Pla52n_26600 [Stieleria varia]
MNLILTRIHQTRLAPRIATRVAWLLLPIILCLVVVSSPEARAQDDASKKNETSMPGAPRLLPEDAMFYIRLDSADDLREDSKKSSIGLMINDPQMRPLVQDVYSTARDLFAMVSDKVGVSLDELLAIPSGQVAVAVIPAIPPDEESRELYEQENQVDDSSEAAARKERRRRREAYGFATVIMIDAGKNVDKLLAIVDRIENQVVTNDGYVRRRTVVDKTDVIRLLPPRQGRPEIEYFEREGTVVFGFGHRTAQDVLEHWRGKSDQTTLAENARFGTLMSRCLGSEETRPQITFFVDPHAIIDRIIKRSGSMTAGFVWPVIQDLGASRVAGIAGSSFRGGEVFEGISHIHLRIEPPRDGVLGLLRPETGDTTPPKWVPSDVSGYTTLNWDIEQAYENFGKVLDNFQGEDSLKRLAEDPLEKSTTINLREDLFKNLTGRLVHTTWMEPPVRLNSQVSVNALELKDSTAAKAVMAEFRKKRPNDLTPETIAGNVVYFGNRARRGNLPENFRQPEPCMMFLGKWLITSDSRKFMERVALADAGNLPRLSNVAEYDLVAGELGSKLDGEKPFMLSFFRGADSLRLFYELAQAPNTRQMLRRAGENNVVAKTFADMIERNEFPPFSEFEKYFAPTGAFAYDEPDGIHIGMFSLRGDAAK